MASQIVTISYEQNRYDISYLKPKGGHTFNRDAIKTWFTQQKFGKQLDLYHEVCLKLDSKLMSVVWYLSTLKRTITSIF